MKQKLMLNDSQLVIERMEETEREKERQRREMKRGRNPTLKQTI